MNKQINNEGAILITVNFEERDGWHIATSPELPGFILADQNKDEIIDDLPEAICVLYSARHNVECRLVPLERTTTSTEEPTLSPWWSALLPRPVINSIAFAT